MPGGLLRRRAPEHTKSQGFDPADYVGADHLGRLLSDDLTVELGADLAPPIAAVS